MPFLNDAYICQDCEWITEHIETTNGVETRHCPKCLSSVMWKLSEWLNRERKEPAPDEIPPFKLTEFDSKEVQLIIRDGILQAACLIPLPPAKPYMVKR